MADADDAPVPPYGADPRWDAYYDAMGVDRLWSQPAPGLWRLLGPRWFVLPLLPWLWRTVLEPVRYAVVWWLWKRQHYYPTDEDWAHD